MNTPDPRKEPRENLRRRLTEEEERRLNEALKRTDRDVRAWRDRSRIDSSRIRRLFLGEKQTSSFR